MITLIPAAQHFHSEMSWLKSNWHFSFDHYYDPQNTHWGALRVFNHDFVAPNSGFPLHPHADMEIITYVISGELTHEDSLGNKGSISAGEVQRMSAGKGIVHSEYNHSKTTTCELVQMWVLPEKKGIPASWEQKKFSKKDRLNRLLEVVSPLPKKDGDALHIHQDAHFFISHLEKGKTLSHATQAERKLYAFVIAGKVEINGIVLEKNDAAKIKNESKLEIKALEDAEWILWDCKD